MKKEKKEFNLIKELEKRAKKEGMTIQGAIFAFKNKKGETGSNTIAEDRGVILRLLEDAKVMRIKLDIENEHYAKRDFKTCFGDTKKINPSASSTYLG